MERGATNGTILMVLRYSVRSRVSLSVTKQGGQAKSEAVAIMPARIIELNTSTKSFRVLNGFDESVIHTVSHQGQVVTFRNVKLLDTLKDLERSGKIYKIK